MTAGEILGILGIVMLMTAFLLNNTKKVRRFSYTYNVLNLFGAGFLAYYAFEINSLIFLVFQVLWVIFAVYFLGKRIAHHEPVLTQWNEELVDLRYLSGKKPKKKRKPVRRKKVEILGTADEGESTSESTAADTASPWPWQ